SPLFQGSQPPNGSIWNMTKLILREATVATSATNNKYSVQRHGDK
ncbi:hypothetical protein GX50_08988, partial [[Emmonsia] crescens]